MSRIITQSELNAQDIKEIKMILGLFIDKLDLQNRSYLTEEDQILYDYMNKVVTQ